MTEPNVPLPTLFQLQVTNNGNQEGKKKAAYLNYEVEPGFTVRLRCNIDPNIDPKKIKRIVSNRVAAQKSRWKKLQHEDDLMKKSNELHRQVSVLRSQVEMATEEKQYLENEQKELKECISVLFQRLISQQGEIEMYRAEIEMLKNNMAHLI